MTRITISICILLGSLSPRVAQTNILSKEIEKIIADKKAKIGISICGMGHKDTLSINGTDHFPMQSIFKFPIAMAVLHEVDKGNLNLSQEIFISKNDLLPNTWSPIRDLYPNGNIRLKLSEILKFTVSESDNNGCDILLRLIGGPQIVNDFMHQIGITDIAIRANEKEMHEHWDIQFLNWTTPTAMTNLLVRFYNQKDLSKESHDFLWKIMTETSTSKNRIRGQLAPETIVAHKTGSSDTNNDGITAAINDVGIVILPDDSYFVISVFVSNSKEDASTNERIIADVAKLAWDYFTAKKE